MKINIKKFITIIFRSQYLTILFHVTVLLLLSQQYAQAHLDYDFTVEDTTRYEVEGHSGNGVFEAKPKENECLGLDILGKTGKDNLAHWCSTVIRKKIIELRLSGMHNAPIDSNSPSTVIQKVTNFDMPLAANPLTVMIGDSKIPFIFPGFVRNANKSNLMLIARPSCPPLKNVDYSGVDGTDNMKNCTELSELAADRIATNQNVSHVFMTFGLRSYNDVKDGVSIRGSSHQKDSFELGLENFILTITRRQKQVIFFIDSPNLTDPYDCFPRVKGIKKDVQGCVIEKNKHIQAISPIVEMVRSIKERMPSDQTKYFRTYDMTNEFCPNNKCSVKMNDKYMYEMVDHLTDYSNDIVSKKIVTDYKLNK